MDPLLKEVEQALQLDANSRLILMYDAVGDRLIFPYPFTEQAVPATYLLVQIHAFQQVDHIVLVTELCRVPPARRAQVALLLGQYNSEHLFSKFSISEGSVRIELTFSLHDVADRADVITDNFGMHLLTLRETSQAILAAAERKRRARSRVEREITELLHGLDDQAQG